MSCNPKGIEDILEEESKKLIKMKEKIISIMSSNTGIEMEKMRLICEVNTELNHELAKKCGFIDIILDLNVKEKNKSGIRNILLSEDAFEKCYYKNLVKNLKSAGVFK